MSLLRKKNSFLKLVARRRIAHSMKIAYVFTNETSIRITRLHSHVDIIDFAHISRVECEKATTTHRLQKQTRSHTVNLL